MNLVDYLQGDKTEPLIMGILNVTPDSFSDGGRYTRQDQLIRRIEAMAEQGAHIIDIGGESTRPGALAVSLAEEENRVLPAIELVKQYSDCWVSIDTYKTEVMRASLALGVDMVNDVNALQAEGALELLAKTDAAVCLMHKQGQPLDMQDKPVYNDVLTQVHDFLKARIEVCERAGINKKRLVLDPGFGFGKSLEHNQTLFQHLTESTPQGYPILVGVSRKTMIAELLGGIPVEQRMLGSVVAALLSVQRGAKIVRVHDVLETAQALSLAKALSSNEL
ncbi:MAG: dihydropteroate synthase [Thiomicrospira sp.]|uniref:dihydropteroate synthase n=1 Tax=Thiomicrospira sp. TaxID=935 RepID=UPI0019FB2F13|nr:dihydropteroate synthase [Thiomicrospira sp.]MBE0493403.1 dihydropteroate synthase [Thiomicrospira sp.]